VPTGRVVRVEAAGARATFATIPAPPPLAVRQWTARYAGSPGIDSSPSIRLLSLAVRARRVVLLSLGGAGPSTRLGGVLAVDGAIAARAERTVGSALDPARAAAPLLRDLLVSGKLLEPSTPLTRRPVFWVVLALAAGLAAGATAFGALYRPPVRAEVRF
jgi:hypothetical protein